MDFMRDDVTFAAKSIRIAPAPRDLISGMPIDPSCRDATFRLHGNWIIVQSSAEAEASIYPIDRVIEVTGVVQVP